MRADVVGDSLVLIANARMPSHRAQSLQVAQMGGAFARAGLRTTLLYARRRDTPPVADLPGLWDYYELPDAARPDAEPIGCIDGIDALPRFLQYLPARLQELTFGRRAARRVRAAYAGARVLSREVESAHALRDRPRLFLEMHRVPGGRVRRRFLSSAASAADGVVAISNGVRDDLVRLGLAEHKLIVEHDGFEAGRFANLPSRADAREELGVPADRPLVVYTGGLLEWKGVDLLIEAARDIPEAFFLIAGGMVADVKRLRTKSRGLENVRFARVDAGELLQLVPTASVSAYYIFYPDPWPKKRHHKRRFLNPSNASQLARTLRLGCALHVATDHVEYWEVIEPLFDEHPNFERLPEFGGDEFPMPTDTPLTNFEMKYKVQGRARNRASWRRRAE